METNNELGIKIFLLICVIITLYFTINSSKSSSKTYNANESYKFDQQLQKNPANWDKEEKRRYDNFKKWEQNQK